MSTTSRTANGAYIELCNRYDIDIVIDPVTTLNTKFDVLAGETPTADEKLINQYFFIGNGGHKSGASVENSTTITAAERKVTANALFSHLAFVMVPVESDLDAGRREEYRMRVRETHHGTDYYCYYGKKFDIGDIVPTTQIRTNNSGSISFTPHTPTMADLSPVQPTGGVSNKDLVVSLTIPFTLTEQEVAEIYDAADIKWGVTGHAVISEIGIASGADRDVSMDNNGTTYTGKEIVACQLTTSVAIGRLLSLGESYGVTRITVGSLDPIGI